MILVLTDEEDVHADRVCGALARRGADVLRFDPALFPSRAALAITFKDSGTVEGWLRTPDGDIPLAHVHAVWLRRPGRPRAHPHLQDSLVGDMVEHEAEAALADIWEMLDARHVPASPDVVVRAGRKMRQLRMAAALGFELPATLVTNEPDAFLDFHGRQRSLMVTKRIGMGQRLATASGEGVARYTDPVRPRDLVHVEDLRLCPVVAQTYVPKQVELRVTVVGEAVFCAAIHSQAVHHTRYDWRRYDMAHTVMESFPLPPGVAQRCRALVRQLGLCYGAIDLIVTPEGRYVFLEVNPNGQYLWVEDATGMPITTALVDLLVDACSSRGCGAAPPRHLTADHVLVEGP